MMAAWCGGANRTITGTMNPGRGCGVLKALERKRSFPVDWRVKKSIERYGRRILASFRPRIRLPDIDYSAWTYSLRAACATCLAFYISFSLNLDGSHWALTTCYIVGSERESGRILAKSVARIIGTLVGATASFVLVNAFAQEGVLFICCFAAWLSVCVFFSHHERGHWAYAWVLSGYTTAIVGIPAALTPVLAFDIISSRAENILIGVLCMGTVSMIAFPESVRPRLVKLVEATDQELFQLLSSCLCLECDPARLNRALKTLTANGVSIQDLRFAFAFEETGTGFSRANLGRFHLECLDVANSSGSLNIHLFSIRGLLADGELPCLRQALDRVYQALSASFHSVQNKKPSAVYARLDQELKELQTAGYISVAGNWQEVPTDAEVVGIVQIRRLVACLLSYLETRSALFTEAPGVRPGLAAKITTPIDIYVAAMAALRVFVTVGSAAFFWIVTAWPAGDTFLTWVGLASCRYVIAPSPTRATAAAFRGMLIAVVPTYLITFYLMPQMDGFAMFVLAIFPFLFFGVGIGTSLRRPVEVGAAILLVAEGLDPANEMQYDVVAFFNGVLATILGVGTVFLMHRLVFPRRANQRKVAALKRLTQRTVRCIDQGKMTGIEYLGSAVIVLNDLLSLLDWPEEPNHNRADWAVDLCALGYEVVTLQQAGGDLPVRLAQYGRKLALEIVGFLREPSDVRFLAVQRISEQAYYSCLRALGTADPDSPSADHIASSLASLAVIRHRFDQPQLSALLSNGAVSLPTSR
jgi:uncharacterized membrane protein YccC